MSDTGEMSALNGRATPSPLLNDTASTLTSGILHEDNGCVGSPSAPQNLASTPPYVIEPVGKGESRSVSSVFTGDIRGASYTRLPESKGSCVGCIKVVVEKAVKGL